MKNQAERILENIKYNTKYDKRKNDRVLVPYKETLWLTEGNLKFLEYLEENGMPFGLTVNRMINTLKEYLEDGKSNWNKWTEYEFNAKDYVQEYLIPYPFNKTLSEVVKDGEPISLGGILYNPIISKAFEKQENKLKNEKCCSKETCKPKKEAKVGLLGEVFSKVLDELAKTADELKEKEKEKEKKE